MNDDPNRDPQHASQRILIIRRDNIGDLVCTTPLISALREQLPEAHLAAYVNTYNLPVLAGNPALDAVHAYTKGKHRRGAGMIAHYWRRLSQLLALRQQKFDDVLIAEPSYSRRLVQLARFFGAKRIIGFAGTDGMQAGLTDVVQRGSAEEIAQLHEVEDVFRLLKVYGVEGRPSAARVYSTASAAGGEVIGLHISARKPSQRWPAARFIALARRLHAERNANIRLFWAPGVVDDPLHPGDDSKAAEILAGTAGLPIEACETQSLSGLIDGLAGCTSVVCSDGGAMHLAAGLGKPIVCLFGKSHAVRWRPWGVPFELLQKPSEDVADIAVEEVAAAYWRLAKGAA